MKLPIPAKVWWSHHRVLSLLSEKGEHAEGKIAEEKGPVTVLVFLSCTSFCRGIADFDVKALTPIQGLMFFCWSHQNLLLSKAKMMKLQQREEVSTSKGETPRVWKLIIFMCLILCLSYPLPCMFGVARLKMMHVTLWDHSNCSMKMWRLHFPICSISLLHHFLSIFMGAKSVPPCRLHLLWESILGLLHTLGNILSGLSRKDAALHSTLWSPRQVMSVSSPAPRAPLLIMVMLPH